MTENEFMEFIESVPYKQNPVFSLHPKSDINLILLLDKHGCFNANGTGISCAEHDEVFFNVNSEVLLNLDETILAEMVDSGLCFGENGAYIFT